MTETLIPIKPMHITKLTAQNVLNMSAVEIDLKEGTTIISGANGAGKSNFLKAIEFALDGKALKKTAEPVKRGETNGKVILDLGDITISRTFTNNRASLQITNSEGMIFKSPQAVLDSFRGHISFDPLDFANIEEKKQKEILLNLIDLPIDLNDVEKRRVEMYNQRTDFNRKVKELTAQRNGLSPYPDLPDIETPAAELMTRYEQAINVITIKKDTESQIEATANKIKEQHELIQNLQLQQRQSTEEIVRLANLNTERELHLSNMKIPDPESIKLELQEVESTNEKIREKQLCNKLIAQITELQTESESLSNKLDSIDKSKTDAIKNANMPVPGLGFYENGITFDDIPLKQCSSSQKIKIFTAIGMALNPELKVIWITDASLLDSKSIEDIKQLTLDNDYQLFLEVVDESGDLGVFIQDGAIIAENNE